MESIISLFYFFINWGLKRNNSKTPNHLITLNYSAELRVGPNPSASASQSSETGAGG